ncbi:ester cyclase [Dehalobacter sp. DCM]|uniref:ester cyclase n=1 Tax=Dehalobacter sp. DCM TaxID=2907827 RepID=UPI003081F6B4|nr:ester cyclase [Dehalobacter sp. DCM]
MPKRKEKIIKLANDGLMTNGNLSLIDEIFTTDYIAHAGGKDHKGHTFIKRYVNQLRSAIPDIKVVNVEFWIQENNTIAWQRTLSGTHHADMFGIPPTKKKITWRDMVISRFEGERIAEEWTVSELAGELLSKRPTRNEE